MKKDTQTRLKKYQVIRQAKDGSEEYFGCYTEEMFPTASIFMADSPEAALNNYLEDRVKKDPLNQEIIYFIKLIQELDNAWLFRAIGKITNRHYSSIPDPVFIYSNHEFLVIDQQAHWP